MIDRQRAISRRKPRAARIRQLLGVELDRQPMRPRCREHEVRFLDREGNGLAERIDRIGEALELRHQAADQPDVTGTVLAMFGRDGMRPKIGGDDRYWPERA